MSKKNTKMMKQNEMPDVYVKIRYTIDGPTQSVKMKDFVKIEDDFLAGHSKFPDGFYGYYHKDALCETPIRVMTPSGSFVEVMKRDGKFYVREVPEEDE